MVKKQRKSPTRKGVSLRMRRKQQKGEEEEGGGLRVGGEQLDPEGLEATDAREEEEHREEQRRVDSRERPRQAEAEQDVEDVGADGVGDRRCAVDALKILK